MKKSKIMRLTRRSYKRKIIMFGASIFTCVAMTASGFAAWVLSQDAKLPESGEIKVGAVTEANVELKDLEFVDKNGDAPIKNFNFEPLRADDEGRVRHSGKDEDPAEDLDIRIGWTLVNYQNADDHYVEVYVPEYVQNAINNNYIKLHSSFVLPEGATPVKYNDSSENYYVYKYAIGSGIAASGTSPDGLLTYTYSTSGGVSTVKFILTLKFEWGSVFDAKNPGEYYDFTYTEPAKKDTMGAAVPYETVKATLNQFKATLHNIEYNAEFEAKSEADKDVLYTANPIPNYYVLVHAKVK